MKNNVSSAQLSVFPPLIHSVQASDKKENVHGGGSIENEKLTLILDLALLHNWLLEMSFCLFSQLK